VELSVCCGEVGQPLVGRHCRKSGTLGGEGEILPYKGMSHSSEADSQSGYYDFFTTGGVVEGCSGGRGWSSMSEFS